MSVGEVQQQLLQPIRESVQDLVIIPKETHLVHFWPGFQGDDRGIQGKVNFLKKHTRKKGGTSSVFKSPAQGASATAASEHLLLLAIIFNLFPQLAVVKNLCI